MSWLITGAQPVPVDPVFNNVSLLLHGNGTNGSTTITDSSPSPKTVTAVGNAQISTTESKFGGASIALDGTGDYLRIDSTNAFNFLRDNFTIESWINLASLVPAYSWLSWRTGVNVLKVGGGSFQLYNVGGLNIAATAAFTIGWQHCACVRNSGVITFYLNGIALANDVINTNPSFSFVEAVGVDIGGSGVYGNFAGYIDELRITKGVARYTANFTPPAAAFPDI